MYLNKKYAPLRWLFAFKCSPNLNCYLVWKCVLYQFVLYKKVSCQTFDLLKCDVQICYLQMCALPNVYIAKCVTYKRVRCQMCDWKMSTLKKVCCESAMNIVIIVLCTEFGVLASHKHPFTVLCSLEKQLYFEWTFSHCITFKEPNEKNLPSWHNLFFVFCRW